MTASTESAATNSLPARFLGWLVAAVSACPRLTVWLMLSLACAGVGVSVANLTVRTSRAALIDPAGRSAAASKKYTDVFGTAADLVVVVETGSPNPQLIRTVLTALGSRLEREEALFSQVLYRIEQGSLRRKGLQFLSATELQRTVERVDRFRPVVSGQQWDLIRTERVLASLRERIQKAEKSGAVPENLYNSADRFARSLTQFLEQTQSNSRYDAGSFYSPLSELLTAGAEENVSDADLAFLMSDDGRLGFLQACAVAQPAALDENSASIRKLRELMAEVESEYRPLSRDLSISLTGIPVLEHDEMRRSAADMTNAGLIALVAVSVVMFLGFRGLRHPMLAVLTLVVALCWTCGAATLLIGHVNILSISFGVILVGLGIGYSICFLCRYLSLRQELYDLSDALKRTAQTAGLSITMSAVTTALAFAAAVTAGFPGLAELGIISAVGVLLCAVATFVFLPALVALSDAGLEADQLPRPLPNAVYRRMIVAWPVIVIAVSGVGLAGIASRAVSYSDGSVQWRVAYDANLMNVHDRTQESVQVQQRLFKTARESLLYAVAVAGSWEETLRLRNEFQKLPSVGRVSELASRLPPEPTAAQKQLIARLQERVSALPRQDPQFPPSNVQAVGSEVERLYFLLKDSPSLTAAGAARKLDGFLDGLSAMPAARATAMFDAFQLLTARAIVQEFGKLATATTVSPVELRDIPESLRSRFLRAEGDQQYWLIRIYPKEEIWDAAPLEQFVRDLRTVTADVSGVPVQNYESASLLHRGYGTVGLYSAALISLVLLFDFLRPGQKLMTIVPPIAVAGFIGHSMFRRTGTVDPGLLVAISLGLVIFIAAVLDYRNLRDSLLALLPPIGGMAVLLGVMAVCGLSLNPVNLIVLPLVLGIGVDNGIQLLHDYRRQIAAGQNSYAPSEDIVNGVLMTTVTSIVGFGSLMVAAHQGLFSIGLLLAIGIGGSLLVALVPLPALLTLVARHQPAPMEPVRLRAGSAATNETARATSAGAPQSPAKVRKAA